VSQTTEESAQQATGWHPAGLEREVAQSRQQLEQGEYQQQHAHDQLNRRLEL
jgi:hypothetical protein